jgi:uncharacterized membrane protein YbhN (UPF0104 family)
MTVSTEVITPGPDPAGSHSGALRRIGQRGVGETWHSLVFAPDGDGATRRRGSDVLRVVASILVVFCCWLVIGVNSRFESSVARALFPAPEGIQWLVSTVWLVGSFGVIAFLVLTAILSRRREVIRDVALCGLVAWGVCLLLHLLWGTHGDRPPDSALQGFNLNFPLVQLAVTFAVVAAALPYLSRIVQRSIKLLIVVLAVDTVVHGSGLPLSAVASLAIGWGLAAALHLAFGSPLGLPSSEEVVTLLSNLGVHVEGLEPSRQQVWGVARFNGTDAEGPLDVSVYGRDAVDAQFLNKFYRFFVYRDSGPTLTLTRLQQVEHEAYLTLMAGRSGAHVPLVVAAGTSGPAKDAVLVTRPPTGRRLADIDGADAALGDAALDGVFAELMTLRDMGIAHGSISTNTIVVGPDGSTGLTDFRGSTFITSTDRSDNDVAAALASVALKVGAERTIVAAHRVLTDDVLARALPRLQSAALDPVSARNVRKEKALLAELRTRGAEEAGAEVPKLAVIHRISGMNLVMVIGSLIGGYALLGVLLNVSKSLSTIANAEWGWVVAAFILAQLTYPSLAFTTTGSTLTPLAYGRVLAVEVSNSFVALAIPMGPLAMRVRFFQKQGSDATAAVSSGAVASSVSWAVKGLLFIIAIPLARGTLHVDQEGGSGGHAHLIWLVAIIILAIALVVGVALAVPRWRRRARAKLAPKASEVWAQVKTLMTRPIKLAEMVGGALCAQLLIVLCMGASLHAFGQHLPLATIIFILTTASMVGGISPVPGGMGVVEAGMIIGLTSAGISQTDAVSATFIQRSVTAYLPPLWGWATLVWIRRKEYI